MFRVDINKIKLPKFERTSLSDGSARFWLYRVNENNKQLLELKPWYGDNFQLMVNLPSQRVIDVFVIIIKSSANCYRLIYSDCVRTEISRGLKNYDEINSYLSNLIKFN